MISAPSADMICGRPLRCRTHLTALVAIIGYADLLRRDISETTLKQNNVILYLFMSEQIDWLIDR